MHGHVGKLNVTGIVYPKLDIQNSVQVDNMFRNCHNLSGNFYFERPWMSQGYNMFYGTGSGLKNFFIPFHYENGVNSLIYNSFKDTSFVRNSLGVTSPYQLFDINEIDISNI